MAKVGVIGGSGLYEMEGLTNLRKVDILSTPFGPPSDNAVTGEIDGVEVLFMPRHGHGHKIPPSQINYRANIYEMKRLGVEAILSVSAVGSLRETIRPMDFVVVDQFVDRTNSGREMTFFTGGVVAHVALADPVSPELTKILIESAQKVGVSLHEKGTYLNMEGPQFSTKAESNLYRNWGMDIIGMTNMAEAKLAREAEISYATLAAVTDFDCWHPGHDTVTVEMIMENLKKNIENAKKILRLAIPSVGKLTSFSAKGALKNAIVTDLTRISEQARADLRVILKDYLK